MKQLVVIALALVLTGCAGLAPAAPTAAPTSTPQVVIQTVLVTVIPTDQPTETPTSSPIPTLTPQIIVVTATGGAAQVPVTGATATSQGAAPQAAVGATSPTATLPANAGGDIFTNLTRSNDHFALRCQPDTITFGVSTANPSVASVDVYYRMEDQLSTSITGWVHGGTMVSDRHGNFSMDFPASRVAADLRSHRAWFDYQFVGISRLGDAVGRSAKISKQITYTIDCTD